MQLNITDARDRAGRRVEMKKSLSVRGGKRIGNLIFPVSKQRGLWLNRIYYFRTVRDNNI